jgi:hypothetical protein
MQTNKQDWMAPMSRQQLKRLRPGFVRVEVLQPNQNGTQVTLDFPVNVRDVTTLDPNTCCDTKYLLNKEEDENTKSRRVLQPQDLRDGCHGHGREESLATQEWYYCHYHDYYYHRTTVHPNTDNDWVAFLSGPPAGPRLVPSYWPGNLRPQTPKLQHPAASSSQYLGQSAGWMATPVEILEFHNELCDGGFVPPFDAPKFPRDGFWRNNVEFWSGGIQLWCSTCAIQRFIPIQQFDQHLLYHSSNNKQFGKPRPRLVLEQHLSGQLQLTQWRAQQEQEQQRAQQHNKNNERNN